MFLNDLTANKQNPRFLKESSFEKLKSKILAYPRLLEKNRITYDSSNKNVIFAGNMRFKTLNYIADNYTLETIKSAIEDAQQSLNIHDVDLLKYSVDVFTSLIETREIDDSWTQDAAELSEEEKQAFIIIDNVSDGNWDFDLLANCWDIDIEDWNIVEFEVEDNDEEEQSNKSQEDDVEEFKIVLNYTEDDYNFVTEQLNKSSQSKEAFIYDLLERINKE